MTKTGPLNPLDLGFLLMETRATPMHIAGLQTFVPPPGAPRDEVFCVRIPEDFEGVGRWYEVFSQTTDEEVHHLMENASRMPPAA